MRLRNTEKYADLLSDWVSWLDHWTMRHIQNYHLLCSNHACWQIIFLRLVSNSISPAMVIGIFTTLVLLVLISQDFVKETTWLILCFLPTVFTFQFKKITKRERPDAIQLVEEKSTSFPSSHATTSTVLLGFIAFLLPNQTLVISIVLGLITTLICYSRIALGVHYLFDVIVGIVWGMICREGIIYLYQIIPQEYYEIGIIWFLVVIGWVFVILYYKKHPEEIPEILGNRSELIVRILTGIIIFLLVLVPILKGDWAFILLMVFIFVEGLLEIITIKKESKNYFLRLAAVIILIAYVYCCYMLRSLPAGRELLLFVVVTVSLSDVSGYFVGKFFGKHKIFPTLSPGKTKEGTVASILIPTMISAFIFYHKPLIIVMAFIAIVFGLLGDLLASLYKRKLQAKDFPKILPGHGGLLDRVDSHLMAITIIYLILKIFQINLF